MRPLRTLALIGLIAASLIIISQSAFAQEPVRRLGVFTGSELQPEAKQAFLERLAALGYAAGRNLQIEFRVSQGPSERSSALLAELLALNPDILVAGGPQNAVLVHTTAPTIPLVFVAVADPVALGLVQNLAHPGGNVTGFATLVPEDFIAKELQLLKTAVPTASRIALLANPTNPMYPVEQAKFPETMRRLGVELFPVAASSPDQLETAFETAHTRRADAILVFGDPLTVREGPKIANLSLQYSLPSMYLFRRNVIDGGLMSYGPNPVEYWDGAAPYVEKILKGTKPGDLPIAQPTRFDLTINLKTARALGVAVPPTLLAQAAEVVE